MLDSCCMTDETVIGISHLDLGKVKLEGKEGRTTKLVNGLEGFNL